MLKVKLTKNYAGVTISGDYNDLDHLYDSIYYLIHGEPISIGEYCKCQGQNLKKCQS